MLPLLAAWLAAGLCVWSAAGLPADPPLPPYLSTCSRDLEQQQLDRCLADSLQRLLPRLAAGAAELGLPPLDPFASPDLLVQYSQGQVQGKLLTRRSTVEGIGGAAVLAVRSALNESGRFRLEADLRFPELFAEGEYKAQGKIVVFPIDGKGVYNISMGGVRATWNLTGEHLTRGRQRYVRISRFSMLPAVEHMQIYASNLFTGNEDFNRAALQFANDFWPFLYGELLPYVDEAWDKVMRAVANKVFLRVPFDRLFPPALH